MCKNCTGTIFKMMINQQIFGKLQTIVKSINSKSVINEETALISESILDSLEFMNYLTKVEETFSITITNSEINDHKLGIMSNMVKHVNSKITES